MKKLVIAALMLIMCLAFAGCTSDGDAGQSEETTAAPETEVSTEAAQEETTTAAPVTYQTIQMGNVEMDIPESWVYDPDDGAETTHIYRSEDGDVEFQIEAMQANEEVTDQILGEMTQQYADEWGFGEIGYNDVTVGDSIPAKIIPVDPSQHPDGKYQRIYTMGKDTTVVAISFTHSSDDFTEMNKAMDSVHFLF